MINGIGVCVAAIAIFITYIGFGLLSPRNRSRKVVLPPLGLLFCIIRYALEMMSIFGCFRNYVSQAAAYSVFILATFGILSVFYVQNATFMNDTSVIGRKLVVASYTALASIVLFTFNAFAACIRKHAFLLDHFKFVELSEIFIHLIVICLLFRYRKQYRTKIFVLLLIALMLYLFAWVADQLVYGLKRSMYNSIIGEINPIAIATMVQICIQFFVFYTVTYEKFFENRIRLDNALISVSQSQIQPHFVNNVLYNIKVLYSSDSKRAENMLDNLSRFLKGNKDAFDTGSMHSFERELEHIECYLDIEKERFDNISVVYDIQTKNFMVPPLTLQPLVENAIQHGLRPKKAGGTLTISTYETSTSIVISVKDDGIGFSMEKPKDDKRKHLGIENTKFRIGKICGGQLVIKSILNVGTEAIITIPKSSD